MLKEEMIGQNDMACSHQKWKAIEGGHVGITKGGMVISVVVWEVW